MCRYQNDGTATITPSRFIERAADEAGDWETEIGKSIDHFLAGDGLSEMQDAAEEVAKDISRVCDRIRTGRLKRSFRGCVTNDGRD